MVAGGGPGETPLMFRMVFACFSHGFRMASLWRVPVCSSSNASPCLSSFCLFVSLLPVPSFFSILLFSSVFYLLSSVFALLFSISFLLFSSTLFFLSLLLFYIFIISPFSLPSSFFSPLSSLSSLFFLSSCDDWKREATGLPRRIVSRFQCMRMIFAWFSHTKIVNVYSFALKARF